MDIGIEVTQPRKKQLTQFCTSEWADQNHTQLIIDCELCVLWHSGCILNYTLYIGQVWGLLSIKYTANNSSLITTQHLYVCVEAVSTTMCLH